MIWKRTTINLALMLMVNVCFVATPFSVQSQSSFNANGAALYYEIYGSGRPLLIINGGPGMNSRGFRSLAQQFSTDYQVIIYDQRGTGKSTLGTLNSETITMDLMARDIEALRMHLGISDWVVLGHSFGGMLAYFYAANYPDAVQGMIQSSSGGLDLQLLTQISITERLSREQRDSLAYYQGLIQAGDTSYATCLKRAEFLAPAYLFTHEHVPVIAERLTQSNMVINGLVWADLRRISFDMKDEMRSFQKPVLIIQGKNDILDTGISILASRTLPQAKLMLLDQCAHYGWLDRPDVYFNLIHEFISGIH